MLARALVLFPHFSDGETSSTFVDLQRSWSLRIQANHPTAGCIQRVGTVLRTQPFWDWRVYTKGGVGGAGRLRINNNVSVVAIFFSSGLVVLRVSMIVGSGSGRDRWMAGYGRGNAMSSAVG